MKKSLLTLVSITLLMSSCGTKTQKTDTTDFVTTNVTHAHQQLGNEIKKIEASGEVLNPVTVKADGTTHYCKYSDWRSGFFPGSIWYLYELTKDESLLPLAIKYTNAIEETKNLTWHHDVGFMVNCSFGNGLRIANVEGYKDIMIQTARSLSTRFRPQAGIIQSWDVKGGWQAERGWECPVIIDNMMNLELLFEVTRLSGDSTFHQIALQHADRTLKEHFRPDGSCYHVIDYSLTDGSVRNRHTAQGYAHESIWSRGQAWAIYGYAICYRYTQDKRYLDQALKTFHMMVNHPNMPEDLVPYWDMLAPNIPNEPRDVSSASCIASALYEISTFEGLENAATYKEYADRIMTSLASPAYRAELGTNNNFLLMHSVGSIPHNAEIDKPLNYADYYFIEALKRKHDLEK